MQYYGNQNAFFLCIASPSINFVRIFFLQIPAVSTKTTDLGAPLTEKYGAFHDTLEPDGLPLAQVARLVGADWHRLARALEVPDADIRQVRHQLIGREAVTILRIWIFLKKEQATRS